jgi:formamidopyrimidine-DNA glycosylase
VGHAFVDAQRYGKFLLFPSDDGRVLVVNPMLTGRFHWAEAGEARRPAPALVLAFEDGHELRYADERRMGRWYLVPIEELDTVPQFGELGPDALTISEDDFAEALRKRRGQLKSTLTNQQFIAGIGNAYSDEILWEAGLHPHRRGATLDDDDRRELYRAMHRVFEWARPIIEGHVREGLAQRKEEWRDHLRVHRRAGEPCPRCGKPVRGRTSGSRETNFCIGCQPLDLERPTRTTNARRDTT